MGCTSSKRIEATVDVYRPAPASFSVFNIATIEEPWRKANHSEQEHEEKPTHVPSPILEKLNALEGPPQSWDEVSKALEVLKPTLNSPAPSPQNPSPAGKDSPAPTKKVKRKSFSFHTLEELDTKLSSKPTELKKSESMTGLNKLNFRKPELKRAELAKPESRVGFVAAVESDGYKPVKENIFLLRDRLEREKEGKGLNPIKRDPLCDYLEKCPPGGADSLVIYTTSLGGVRRTYEDCNKVRSILELHGFIFDERDVSLHGGFLNEVKELVGEGVSVPRVFVKGRYIGGVDEVMGLNEMGRLRRMLNWAGIQRGVGRQGCEGCGGARFVPCLDCGGSCKVVVGDNKERCSECNENGLVHCPTCS
ncbi:hypothetical protein LguiB_028967 [Lonicera macranthoides]